MAKLGLGWTRWWAIIFLAAISGLIIVGFLFFSFDKNSGPPIDVVYTWVDGSDPLWRRKKEQYSGEPRSDDNVRYHSIDELKYSLRSISQYAPWVNHIYIVVDDVQVPAFLNVNHPKITVVKHSDIIDPDALPLFNSVAIETGLHHIPGLSECFLYFNDDMFLGAPISKSDVVDICYSEPNHPSFPTVTVSPKDEEWICNIKQGFHLVKQKYPDAELVVPAHISHFCRKSLCYEIENEFPDVFQHTTQQKFRKKNDDDLCQSICLPKIQYQLGVCKGVYRNIPSTPEIYRYFEMTDAIELESVRALRDEKPMFFCINNNNTTTRELRDCLESLFPNPSPFELK